ncbi:MAG: tRNA(1)(Val) ((37)-N(6))-methyltransferase [Bacteroidota bacterium]
MAESRSTFHFKGFSMEHGNPGLKIGTEACIFGAYLASWAHGNMLEIGTGSGVLAAMIAQFHPESTIDAVEIFPEVADLAQKNFNQLPFSHHINLLKGDIKEIFTESTYDFIFSNPPFFVNHLSNSSKSKQTAMHSDDLTPEELMHHLNRFTHDQTEIALIYPPEVMEKVLRETRDKKQETRFYVKERIQIIPNEGGKVLREIICLSQEQKSERFFSLVVKNKQNEYTDDFKELLRPYYLIFP